jgi:hypothetical protein
MAAVGCIAPIRVISRAVSSVLFWSATSGFEMPGVSIFGATGVTPQPASARARTPAPANRPLERTTMIWRPFLAVEPGRPRRERERDLEII